MKYKTDEKGNPYLELTQTDYGLIMHSLFNKGMGFTEEERDSFNLHGLLPPHVKTIEDQRATCYSIFKSKKTNLDKHTYLLSIQNSNEILFFSLVAHHIEEMMPIIYTPIVGEGCMQFSRLYRRPRGLFLSYPHKDKIEKILSNPRFNDVEVIVVSDGERILGLGDQGAGGMGIPIGKLSLYTACAGIHPKSTLPILLDTGTNNPELIDDPAYIGWRHARVRGKEYDDFIETFVTAVKKRFPHILLQWEDFAKENAAPLLDRYKDTVCSFNDDIQGTAAVALSAILSALHITKTSLCDQRIVIAGAGSAGCGIARMLAHAMALEGMSHEKALSQFFLVDHLGLLTKDRKDLLPFQEPFAQNMPNSNLAKTIEKVRPTILIGTSGVGGLFTKNMIEEMKKHTPKPIIFPLSNPTSKCEATPEDLMKWTEGSAIIGTGSPFPPVDKKRIDQINNSYIFPGLGLGIISIKANKVEDTMLVAAAKALSDCSPCKNDPLGNLFPPLKDIREISYEIALAVAASADPSLTKKEIEQAIKKKMWTPEYIPYKKSPESSSQSF